MRKDKNSSDKFPNLRNRAEELLNKTPSAVKKVPPQDIKNIVEELQIHQVELEMQNEELRQTQLELEQVRDKYVDLYDFAPVGYFTISEKGMIQEANLNGAIMLGVERRSLVGKPFSRFITKDTQNVFYQHRIELLKTKNKQPCELRFVKSDGHQFYGQMDCIAVFDENGDLEHIRISITDITDRKRADEALKHAHDDLERRVEKRTAELDKANKQLQEENEGRNQAQEALRESEEKYRTLLENAGEAVLVAQDGVCKFANPKAEELFGYSKEELASNPFTYFIHEEDREMVKERYEKRIEGEAPPDVYPYRIINKGGQCKWVELNVTLFSWEERPATLCFMVDISDRKRAEEVLLEYREAVEGSEELITAVDGQYVYSLANEAFLRYHCLNRDQVIGRNIVDVMGKEIFESIIEPNAERCFKGEAVDFHMKHIYPGYGERYMQVSNYPLKNNDEEMTGMVIVARDVTVSKLAAEGLKESDEKYRSLVEATSDWIWEVDIEGVYTYTNSKVKDILGYEPEEILGKTPFDFMLPDEQKRLTEWFKDTLESHKPFEEIENTNIHKDGRQILLETSGVPIFDTDGNLSGYRGIDRNITRRKLAEVALQTRTNTLAERVKELNCLYGISDLVSKPGVSLDEILQGVVDLIPPSWRYPEIACSRIILGNKEFKSRNFQESVWKQAQSIIVRGKTLGTLEVCYFEERPEQDEGPFLTEERLLIKAAAERLGKTIERRQTEEALQKAHNGLENRVEERTAELMSVNEKLNQEIEIRKQTEKDLEESTQKIKLFAYSVSHDLKSPTISIYGLTKRLSRLYGNILDEKGKTCCNQILKASEQIAGLAENINVYISTKEAPITIENVNLKELFQMVREEIAPQLSIRKIKWSQPDHLPGIRADRLSIVRIIRNLVDNALKYGGDDLSEISIEYQKSDESHILSVMDDGIGLKAGDSKEIFDTFKRTETSRGIDGAGLGLAIVKEIAERHAGKIWMKRGPERGINFSVSISRNLLLSH